MRALVVYESMFGNTEIIARAVADGISSQLPVELAEVGTVQAGFDSDLDLLVVGAPTHAFSLSRPASREEAGKKAEGQIVSTGIGLREWLDQLHRGRPMATAAFDTRIKIRFVPGSAAKVAQKRLRELGFPPAGAAGSFYVSGTPGPLLDGEEDRARQWGEELAAKFVAGRSGASGKD